MPQAIESHIIPASTSDATAIDLLSYEVPLHSMIAVDVEIMAYRNQANRAYWKIHAVGSRANGSASALQAPVEERKRNDAGAAGWTAAILLVNDAIVVRIGGQAAIDISWMIKAVLTISTPEQLWPQPPPTA